MNRGSALKWVQALRECTAFYDNSQLGFVNNDDVFLSPMGVLCRFVDPQGETVNPMGDLTWSGEVFYLTPSIQKRIKAKSKDLSVDGIELYIHLDSVVGRTSNRPFEEAAEFIERHYQEM